MFPLSSIEVVDYLLFSRKRVATFIFSGSKNETLPKISGA